MIRPSESASREYTHAFYSVFHLTGALPCHCDLPALFISSSVYVDVDTGNTPIP